VETLAKRGSRAGKILKRWKRHEIEVPIAAILILNTAAHTVGATMAGSSYEKIFGVGTTAIFSGVFTLAILLLTEIVPKTLGVAFADRLASPVTMAVRAMVFLFWPVIKMTSWLSRLLTRGSTRPVTSIEEIRLLAALGEHEGTVGARFASFVEGIASLRELTAHDVMVPRVGIAFLSGKKSFEDNLETVRASGHSRFPFTPTGDLDDVDGIVLAKELLFVDRALPEDTDPAWDTVKSPLLVVPESNSLDKVLRLFQEQRKHLAVVVDEYGGTQGVLTMEDVLEEIVGEIEDETDRVEQLITKRQDGTYRCRGMAEVRKLFRLLDLDEKVEAVTVAGLVADILGHVPKEGDEVIWKRLYFRVEQASKRRAERVRVELLPVALIKDTGDEEVGD
jgi:CBS domain containing-hemolysin-like protein